jgi:GNAT superfamily N-acetyltransferase
MPWLTTPAMVEPRVRNQLLECWREVSNAGGAVGFPFPPVSDGQVLSSIDTMVRSLDQQENRILLATVNGKLAGWLLLAGNSNELTAHWARVLRVQTALEFRNCGVGRALMEEVARAATEDLALEQLHLELRAGMGLEGFYQSWLARNRTMARSSPAARRGQRRSAHGAGAASQLRRTGAAGPRRGARRATPKWNRCRDRG